MSTPTIGTRHPLADEQAAEFLTARLAALEASFPARHGNRSHDEHEPVDNNGFTSPRDGIVDWAKQERLHHNVGAPNDQFNRQVRGRTVAGAGKGQKDKKS